MIARRSRRCAPRTPRGHRWLRQTEDVEGLYSGPYDAGGVWAVLDGAGTATANGVKLTVDGPGCYPLISHPRSTHGRAGAVGQRRRPLPRGVLHPRGGAGPG